MTAPERRPQRQFEYETAALFDAYYRRIVEPMIAIGLSSSDVPTELKVEIENLNELYLVAISEGERATPQERKDLMKAYGDLMVKIIHRPVT